MIIKNGLRGREDLKMQRILWESVKATGQLLLASRAWASNPTLYQCVPRQISEVLWGSISPSVKRATTSQWASPLAWVSTLHLPSGKPAVYSAKQHVVRLGKRKPGERKPFVFLRSLWAGGVSLCRGHPTPVGFFKQWTNAIWGFSSFYQWTMNLKVKGVTGRGRALIKVCRAVYGTLRHDVLEMNTKTKTTETNKTEPSDFLTGDRILRIHRKHDVIWD